MRRLLILLAIVALVVIVARRGVSASDDASVTADALDGTFDAGGGLGPINPGSGAGLDNSSSLQFYPHPNDIDDSDIDVQYGDDADNAAA